VQPKTREKAQISGVSAGSPAPEQSAGSGVQPLLMVDIDGVISLFGVPGKDDTGDTPRGSLHAVDGTVHFLSATAASHLLELAHHYELVWASGWEDRAEEHLPRLLGLPAGLPYLRFGREPGNSGAHWKLEAIERYAQGRALAWVDDCFNEACHEWAAARTSPTLLVRTEPRDGLTERECGLLREWAAELAGTRGEHGAEGAVGDVQGVPAEAGGTAAGGGTTGAAGATRA
jgi:hypothetical protein